MIKKPECNHVIGYTESNDYDGDTLTEFVNYPYFDLSTATELKSSKGSLFNFCPNCGKNLDGLLEKHIEYLTSEKEKIAEENRIKKEKSELIFQQKVLDTSRLTKLDQLPEEGSFVVIFNPTNRSYGKEVVIVGSKQSILGNCVHYNSNKSNPDVLSVKTIYKVFSQEYLGSILVGNGWKAMGSEFRYFEKTEGNKNKQINLDIAGIIYITEKITDPDDGDVFTNYDRFAIHRLEDYLGVPVDLETITLKE